MIRRAVPGDGTGNVVLRGGRGEAAGGAGGAGAGGGSAVGGAGTPSRLTYIEAAVVDFAICRSAAWFAGWTSSSFSVTLAHYRHLDHRSRHAHAAPGGAPDGAATAMPTPPRDGNEGAHYYAYCSASKAGRDGSLTREVASGRLRLHTCKKPSKRALERQQTVVAMQQQS